MIWFKNIFSDPNKADNEAHHWRRQFQRILVSKNMMFHFLPQEELMAMERKLEDRGYTLQQACEEEEGVLDFDRLYRDAMMERKFRKLMLKAMIDAGVRELGMQEQFLERAVGADYQTLAYQLWPERIAVNCKLNVHAGMSVYQVIRTAAYDWKKYRIIVPVTFGGVN